MERTGLQTGTDRLDRIRGCMLGGAVGDALGYPVEFMDEDEIRERYPSGRIERYDIDFNEGQAVISDDTQMALFTASGLLVQETGKRLRGTAGRPREYVEKAYQDWLDTQISDYGKYHRSCAEHSSWLMDVPELWARRAPGGTCLSALQQIRSEGRYSGDGIRYPLNNSKGCGGIMRIAPIALWYRGEDLEALDLEAAQIAAITHGHPLGYLSAAALAHILHGIVFGDGETALEEVIRDAQRSLTAVFGDTAHVRTLNRIMETAMELSAGSGGDLDNIHRLGAGWTGEETLGIALYCALRYRDDFSRGIIAAVNHEGDSDSTGAVAGNLLGAMLGCSAIGDQWKRNLELSQVILEIADDLCLGCQEDAGEGPASRWMRKYVDMCWK